MLAEKGANMDIKNIHGETAYGKDLIGAQVCTIIKKHTGFQIDNRETLLCPILLAAKCLVKVSFILGGCIPVVGREYCTLSVNVYNIYTCSNCRGS